MTVEANQPKPIPYIKVPKAIGILIILIGIAHAAYHLDFVRRAKIVEATVLETQTIRVKVPTSRIRSSGTHRSLLHTIEFTDMAGNTIISEIHVNSSGVRPDRGTTIEVLYLSSSPQTVRLNTWLATWGTGFIISISGLAFWILSSFVMKNTQNKKVPAHRLLRMRLPRL